MVLIVLLIFRAAEARAASFEQSLSRFDNDHPDIRQHVTAEAEARQQLADVAKQLEKYQSVYGDSSSLPPDVKQLSDELQRKEDEVQKLRLLDTQRGEVIITYEDCKLNKLTFYIRLKLPCTRSLISYLLLGKHLIGRSRAKCSI